MADPRIGGVLTRANVPLAGHWPCLQGSSSPRFELLYGRRRFERPARRLGCRRYPYVSLGPRPLTVRPPLRQFGAAGPSTWMLVTTPSPSSVRNFSSRLLLSSRSCVAQAVESVRTCKVVSVKLSGVQCAEISGPTSTAHCAMTEPTATGELQ